MRTCAAALLQLGGKATVVAGQGDGMVAQPGAELFGIGNRRLTEAEQGADLGPLPLQRAIGGAGQQQGRATRRRHAERARQPRHHVLADLAGGAREAAAGAEEQQHDGEAQPAGPALGLDQQAVRRRQVPGAVVEPWRSCPASSRVSSGAG